MMEPTQVWGGGDGGEKKIKKRWIQILKISCQPLKKSACVCALHSNLRNLMPEET